MTKNMLSLYLIGIKQLKGAHSISIAQEREKERYDKMSVDEKERGDMQKRI